MQNRTSLYSIVNFLTHYLDAKRIFLSLSLTLSLSIMQFVGKSVESYFFMETLSINHIFVLKFKFKM